MHSVQCGCNVPALYKSFVCLRKFLSYLFTSLRNYFFRIDTFCSQATGRKRQSIFLCSFCPLVYFVADVCLLLLCSFSFSVLSQEIGCQGWEERLQNDLFWKHKMSVCQ